MQAWVVFNDRYTEDDPVISSLFFGGGSGEARAACLVFSRRLADILEKTDLLDYYDGCWEGELLPNLVFELIRRDVNF